jgi:hypothetical protein
MGSVNFFDRSSGKTAKDAFSRAHSEAIKTYGNHGYTGTIAEKDSFVMFQDDPNRDIFEYTEELLDHPEISSKWGPAGCIQTGTESFVFFGWASY